MKEKLQRRLAELQEELAKGNELLQRLQQQESDLQEQMLRISGAVQVLEELIAAADQQSIASPAVSETEGAGEA